MIAIVASMLIGIPPQAPPVRECPPQAPPVLEATVTKTVVTHRAARGHTHTCRNGHTWDHAANPSHVCQFCGATQYVQDRVARPVTVMRTLRLESPPPVMRTPALQLPVFRTIQAGNCANGKCSIVR